MKIAIDISQVAYADTGVANYTKGLVSSVLKIDKKNDYLLFAYSARRMDTIKKFLGILKKNRLKFETRLFNFPQTVGNLIWNKWHIFGLEKLIGESDVYHSSDWIQMPAKCKKLTTVHDLVVYKYPETSNSLIVKTQKTRMAHVKKDCDLILADSQATKKDLISILGIKSEKIKVVYPGINDTFKNAQNNSKNILSRHKINSPYFLTVGTNDPRKNINRVISAYKKLLTSLDFKSDLKIPALVIISGSGWGVKIEPEENIKILNNITESDLSTFYKEALMFVYPSLYEGFGLPVIEAFESSCPVITSNRGSLSEVAGSAALVVDPDSTKEITKAMLKIFKSSLLRKEMIKKGIQKAKQFSWEKSAKEVVKIYESLKR